MRKHWIRATVLALLLACTLLPAAQALNSLYVREGASATFTGKARMVTDDETPYYDANGKEQFYSFMVLTLTNPSEATLYKDYGTEVQTITEVQVADLSGTERTLALSGQEVTVTGTVVFASTRYHYRDIVLTNATAVPASTPAGQAPAAPQAPSQAKVSAKAGNIDLTLNGSAARLGTYNINGNNYVKLRDVAQMLRGTGKEFSVTWNAGAQRIDLASGSSYIPVGGELAPLAAGTQTALPSSAAVYLDGAPVSLTAYNVNGNNFFKLRDLGSALGFYVGWDESAKLVVVDTTRGYSEDSPQPSTPAAGGPDDAELLALAKNAAGEMRNMIYAINLGALLEQDWDDTAALGGPDDYFKVIGCNSMKELEDYWYQKFARKYTIEQVAGSDYKTMYQESNGALYTMNLGIGGLMETVKVDSLVSRNGDEAVFRGHLEFDGSEYGKVELSLVNENGTWKYGYCKEI